MRPQCLLGAKLAAVAEEEGRGAPRLHDAREQRVVAASLALAKMEATRKLPLLRSARL
jgi:hypothetical protein